MIDGNDIYKILCAIVPLYVTMILAYTSVKWCKIFSPQQICGINRFIALIIIPFLVFDLLSKSNPYKMSLRIMAADILQKVIVVVVFAIWCRVSRSGSLKWFITLTSIATIPNVLVMGVPLLSAMYGDDAIGLLMEMVVLQCIIWSNLLLLGFEYNGAMFLLKERLPDKVCGIASIRVDSDVLSLDGKEPIQAEAEIGEDNTFHVFLKKSVSIRSDSRVASRLSPRHSRTSTPRCSSFNDIEFYSTYNGRNVNTINPRKSNGYTSVAKESCHPDVQDNVTGLGLKKLPPNGTDGKDLEDSKPTSMPPTTVLIKLILIMVWRKLSRNPTIYASLVGLAWSLVSYRWEIKMPVIIENSITILSSSGVGMAIFSLGLFMSVQPRILSCGKKLTVLSMSVRFLVGPAAMAAASYAVGLRGKMLQITIVQAALPQALFTYVFAKEYNVHPEIQTTGVAIGMLVALPVTIIYYLLLGL